MASPATAFDQAEYRRINEVRAEWLARVLDALPFRDALRSALDVGCGAGYFADVLARAGLAVTGIDLQPANIERCRERYPAITFRAVNLDEDFSLDGTFDLVLMFGILYHLQSPLQTLLRLAGAVGRVGVVETRVAAGDAMACYLFREYDGEAHNVAAVTAVPTLPALIRLLHHAGFDHVYRPAWQPQHEQWTRPANGQRHCLVIAREAIRVDRWEQVGAPDFLKKWEPMIAPRRRRAFALNRLLRRQ